LSEDTHGQYALRRHTQKINPFSQQVIKADCQGKSPAN
jgi:hypothetical protein